MEPNNVYSTLPLLVDQNVSDNSENLVSWQEYGTITCSVTFGGCTKDQVIGEIFQPTIPTDTELNMMRREIQQLTETLYSQYKRIAVLVTEVTSLTNKLNEK